MIDLHIYNNKHKVIISHLDWLFMLVLPVALLTEPWSRQAAISLRVVTLTSVDPANVITPLDDSLICIGGFPGTCATLVSDLLIVEGSSKSCTSSLWIYQIKWSGYKTLKTKSLNGQLRTSMKETCIWNSIWSLRVSILVKRAFMTWGTIPVWLLLSPQPVPIVYVLPEPVWP